LAREENCGRLFGELIEVANKVRLVVVTTFNGYIGPRGVTLLHRAKYLLKSDDPRQQLWTDTDFVLKTAFELSIAHARVGCELIY
jgi:hypothetical protein